MKRFYVYQCRNSHINYIERGKNVPDCKECGFQLSLVHGVTVGAESEDELSRKPEYDDSAESILSARITGN